MQNSTFDAFPLVGYANLPGSISSISSIKPSHLKVQSPQSIVTNTSPNLAHQPLQSPSPVMNDKNNNSISNLAHSKSSLLTNHQSPRDTAGGLMGDVFDSKQLQMNNYNLPPVSAIASLQAISTTINDLFKQPLPPTPLINSKRPFFESNNNKNFTIERLSSSPMKTNKASDEAKDDGSTDCLDNCIDQHLIEVDDGAPSSSSSFANRTETKEEDSEIIEIIEKSKQSAVKPKFNFGQLDRLNGSLSIQKISESSLDDNWPMSKRSDEQATLESLKRKDSKDVEEAAVEYAFEKRPYDINLNYSSDNKSDSSECDVSIYSDSTSSGIDSPKLCPHSFCDSCQKGDTICCKQRLILNKIIKIRSKNANDQESCDQDKHEVTDDGGEDRPVNDKLTVEESPAASQSIKDEGKELHSPNESSNSSNFKSDDDELVDDGIAESPSEDQLILSSEFNLLDDDVDVCQCLCSCNNNSKINCKFNGLYIKILNDFYLLNLNKTVGWKWTDIVKLSNLHQATQMIVTGDLNENLKNSLDSDMIALHLQQFAVSKFINAFKFLPRFNQLCKEDQKRLLQPCCAELLLLRSTKHFDSLKEEWKVRSFSKKTEHIKLSLDNMKESEPSFRINLHDSYLKFCENVKREWREDDLFMTMVFVIVLFSSHYVFNDRKLSE